MADPPGRIVGGSIRFAGTNLLELSESAMEDIRGNAISMIFQEPMTSLNPLMTIGRQISEAVVLHQRVRGARGGSERSRRCAASISRSRSAASMPTRTSFPAACGSA